MLITAEAWKLIISAMNRYESFESMTLQTGTWDSWSDRKGMSK